MGELCDEALATRLDSSGQSSRIQWRSWSLAVESQDAIPLQLEVQASVLPDAVSCRELGLYTAAMASYSESLKYVSNLCEGHFIFDCVLSCRYEKNKVLSSKSRDSKFDPDGGRGDLWRQECWRRMD